MRKLLCLFQHLQKPSDFFLTEIMQMTYCVASMNQICTICDLKRASFFVCDMQKDVTNDLITCQHAMLRLWEPSRDTSTANLSIDRVSSGKRVLD